MLNNIHNFRRLVLALVLVSFCGMVNVALAVTTPWKVGGTPYAYRQEITVSNTLTASDLTDYPLLVQVTNPSNPIFTNSVDGSDILFTAGDGSTELSREIETFTTGGSPMLNAWVKTDVSSAADTKIFMYYNGDSVANTTDTWDSNFTLVQHLQEDPVGPLLDSTAFGNNGTNAGTVSAPGKIGAALDFDGTSTVNLGNDSSLFPTDVTVEAWVKAESISSHGGIFTNKTGPQYGFSLQAGTTQDLSGLVGGGATSGDWTYVGAAATSDPVADEWYHLTLTHENGTENRFYVDGVQVGGIQNRGLAYAGGTLPEVKIGAFYSTGSTLRFNGIIDELRLSNTARSADWINANFSLGDNNGAFLSFGAEETPPVPEPSTSLLLALGMMGLVRVSRRRPRRA